MTHNLYIAKPVLEWLRERINGSLAGIKFREAATEIERLRAEQCEFKNFHRLLCECFGYTHDEIYWERDQLSLIEWIAQRRADEPILVTSQTTKPARRGGGP